MERITSVTNTCKPKCIMWESYVSDLPFVLKSRDRCHKNNFTSIELRIHFVISDCSGSMRLTIVTEKKYKGLFNNNYLIIITTIIITTSTYDSVSLL